MGLILPGVVVFVAGGFLVYLVASFVIAGAAGTVFGSATSVWIAAAASLVLLPCCVIERERARARAEHAAVERARAALLVHGPAAKVNRLGQWERFYFALRHGELLWWKDAEAWGKGSTDGGNPNNGKELGQFNLIGAKLTCPPPSNRLELGSLFGKNMKRLILRNGGTGAETQLLLIFRVGKEDAAAAKWESALRRALAPPAQAASGAPRPPTTPPPSVPVVTGSPVEQPRKEKPAAAWKALELV